MAKLDALSSKNLTQTIASPKVVTLNNLAAKITNATNFNFVVTANDNNASSTLNTVSTGMTLNITPSVIPAEVPGSKRLVRLNINAKYSTPSGGTGTTVQTDDQEVQTNVIIPEQATFILGGLFDINRTENQAGIPGFSDIPLFGHLFKTSSSGDTKNETLFLISPSIYESEQIAGRDGGRIREYVKEEKFIMRQERENLYRNSHLLNTGYNLDEDE
jgi:type II secretory pathway component GspD/PulD (secretin)